MNPSEKVTSPKLKRDHRFHTDRDFDKIIRWLTHTKKSDQAVEPSKTRQMTAGHPKGSEAPPLRMEHYNQVRRGTFNLHDFGTVIAIAFGAESTFSMISFLEEYGFSCKPTS